MLKYDYTRNLGDQIQSIAANKLIPHIDHFIDRAELSNFCSDEKVKTILNAWYFHFNSTWPPSDSIEPLLISMHINLNDDRVVKTFLSEESKEYLRKYGPVGARDQSTFNFFRENNIDSYFSGCLTLTLNKNPNIINQDYIVAVDVPDNILSFLKTKTNKKIYDLSHMAPLDLNKPLNNFESLYDSKEKFIIANNLLNLYQGASCVLTNRLHVALPCLAFETPVLLLNNYYFDVDRFSGLENLLNFTYVEDYLSNYDFFDIENPPENKKNYLNIRKDLTARCKKFTGHINNDRTIFEGDADFFVSLLSKTSKNINNHIYNYISSTEKIINELKSKENTIKKQKKTIRKMKLSNSWNITEPLRKLNKFFK